jgi:hypothetical protein
MSLSCSPLAWLRRTDLYLHSDVQAPPSISSAASRRDLMSSLAQAHHLVSWISSPLDAQTLTCLTVRFTGEESSGLHCSYILSPFLITACDNTHYWVNSLPNFCKGQRDCSVLFVRHSCRSGCVICRSFPLSQLYPGRYSPGISLRSLHSWMQLLHGNLLWFDSSCYYPCDTCLA